MFVGPPVHEIQVGDLGKKKKKTLDKVERKGIFLCAKALGMELEMLWSLLFSSSSRAELYRIELGAGRAFRFKPRVGSGDSGRTKNASSGRFLRALCTKNTELLHFLIL